MTEHFISFASYQGPKFHSHLNLLCRTLFQEKMKMWISHGHWIVIRLYIPYFMSRHRGHIKFLKSLEMCVFCSYNKFIHSHSFNPSMINSLTTFSLLHWLTKSFNNHLKYHYPFEDILTHCESNLFLRYFSISLTFCDSFYGNYDNHHS